MLTDAKKSVRQYVTLWTLDDDTEFLFTTNKLEDGMGASCLVGYRSTLGFAFKEDTRILDFSSKKMVLLCGAWRGGVCCCWLNVKAR